MKLQYLGTGAAEGVPAIFCECEICRRSFSLGGRNIRTRSQALLDDTVLIDFPADTYMHYLNRHIPLNKIKTCIVTHSHMDHLHPPEIEMRKNGFSHLETDFPLTFYAAQSGYDAITDVIKAHSVPESDVKAVRITPFVPFTADGYTITPLKAEHDIKATPVFYAIEKNGKSLLYAHDTSEPSNESMNCLRAIKKPFDLISLDCTQANDEVVPYVGHMSLNKCDALRRVFISEGIASSNTVFVLNHFSHNGKDAVYDDFSVIAAKRDFITSYDGMTIEF